MAEQYLILDSEDEVLAHGYTDDKPGHLIWRLTIDQGDIEMLMQRKQVKIVGTSDELPAVEGYIRACRGERVVEIQTTRELGEKLRQNLRVPVWFDTYIYPLEGYWRGRRTIISQDISCGGISFYCVEPLHLRERFEVVIPITKEPLVVLAEVIHIKSIDPSTTLYAAKFPNLIHDEEKLLRNAVFTLQRRSQYCVCRTIESKQHERR